MVQKINLVVMSEGKQNILGGVRGGGEVHRGPFKNFVIYGIFCH